MYLNKQAPALLANMFQSAITHEPLDVETREWLGRGILTYIRGEKSSLDAALGLSTAGQRGIRTILLLSVRNAHLCESLNSIALDESVSTWGRCQRLANQVGRLIPVWDARRGSLHNPLDGWPTWQRSLFLAWQAGLDIPGTAEGLLSITKSTSRYSFNSDDLKILSRYI